MNIRDIALRAQRDSGASDFVVVRDGYVTDCSIADSVEYKKMRISTEFGYSPKSVGLNFDARPEQQRTYKLYLACARTIFGQTFQLKSYMVIPVIHDYPIAHVILFNYTCNVNAFQQTVWTYAKVESAEPQNEEETPTGYSFLANMAHEIRTPLTAILGVVKILADTELDDAQQECVEIISNAGLSLIAIVNDTLDFTRLNNGKMQLNKEVMDVRQIVDMAISVVVTRAREKGLAVNKVIESAVPQTIMADKHRILQILINFLSNAVKFTDNGRVMITVTAKRVTDIAYNMTFTVSDTGIGIRQADIAKLFKSFSQLDGSDTKKYQGTGLGLAICKNLAELMGGSVGVDSVRDRGSDFYFSIPAETTAAEPRTSRTSLRQILVGKHILLISKGAKQISDILVRWGMNVTSTSVLDETDEYDAVLVDTAARIPEGDLRVFNCPLIALVDDAFPLVANGIFTYRIGKNARESKLIKTLQFTIEEHMKQHYTDRILVAEDNTTNQKIITNYLGRLGYENIDIVENGKMAVEMYAKHQHKIVILDVKMPIMSGPLASNQIKNMAIRNKWIAPYIIALSAVSTKDDISNYMLSGSFNTYVCKPVELEELRRCLSQAISGNSI